MVSDLNKNFGGSTVLAKKKARIGGFAYPYSPLSFNNIIFCPSNEENLSMFWQFSLPVEFTHELKNKGFVVSVTLSL